jgi:hypothetical protein
MLLRGFCMCIHRYLQCASIARQHKDFHVLLLSTTCRNVTGATACIACQQGLWSAPAAVSCSATGCPAGTFATSTGCEACPAGTYAKVGASACTPCPTGTSSTTVGAANRTSCTLCSAGSFANQTGSTTCEKCPAGTASGAKGATSSSACVPCPLGSFRCAYAAAGFACCAVRNSFKSIARCFLI